MQKLVLSLLAAIACGALVAACGGQRETTAKDSVADASSCDAGTGRISIATGNSTGVYYVVGGGIAKLLNSETKLQTKSAETGASVQNVEQIVAGDYQIGFSLADTAADAVNGTASFKEKQPIAALGRIYPNYTQVVARTDSGIESVEDFAGKTISTGSPLSGTEVIADRLIEAAGVKGKVRAQRLDLTKTVDGMKDGSIDGLVWSGGLPTPALTDLFTSLGNKVKMIDVSPLLPKLQAINEVYEEGKIPAGTYGESQGFELSTIVVPNVLVVRDDMADNVACAITQVIYKNTEKLTQVHPASKDILPATAGDLGPIPLHPGSKRGLETLDK